APAEKRTAAGASCRALVAWARIITPTPVRPRPAAPGLISERLPIGAAGVEIARRLDDGASHLRVLPGGGVGIEEHRIGLDREHRNPHRLGGDANGETVTAIADKGSGPAHGLVFTAIRCL